MKTVTSICPLSCALIVVGLSFQERRTSIRVGLLAIAAVVFLTSVAAQSPEETESSVTQVSPSSQPPGDSEVPPEQSFIELSRTKKLSNARRRPSSRRFRTSTTTSSPETPRPTPTSNPETTHTSTTEAATVTSTAATASQPPISAPEAISTTPAPLEQNPQQDTTVKEVQFVRPAKLNRGRVFTFTFKKSEDNKVKEKQSIQSRIPARFSPAFAPKRRGSVPQAPSETNQPNNLAINSGPPGDVPRARPSGRELNRTVADGQKNQISQSQDSEAKATPVNVDEPSIPERRVKFLPPSIKPKSKSRPYKGQVNSSPDVSTTQPRRESQKVNEEQTRESSSPPSRLTEPLQGSQTVLPNNAETTEASANPSSQTLVEERDLPTGSPAPPRIRYVKAGSLRFFPNRRENLEPPRNFEDTTTQPSTANEGQSFADRGEPLRPDTRPSSPRFLPDDIPLEPTRNFVEPTPPTLIPNKEQDSQEGDNSNTPAPPNRPLKPGSPRFLSDIQTNQQEIPPEIVRDFANLQTLIANGEIPARFSSPAPQSPDRPFNPELQRFLPSHPNPHEELPPELRQNFADPTLPTVSANEGQDQQPNRPITFLTNEEILQALARQRARDFAAPTSQTPILNEGQNRLPDRPQEHTRSNRPLDEASLRFIPNDLQRLPPQSAREYADRNLHTLIENERQGPVQQESPRSNRPLNEGTLRFIPTDPQLPPQSSRGFSGSNLESLRENEDQGPVRFNSQVHTRPNRPLNTESQRFLPNADRGLPPQAARDFADPNIQTLIESEDQGPVRFNSQEYTRPNRPLNADPQRFLPNGARELPLQSARDFADPNQETLIESEGQGPVRFNSQDLTRHYRPSNAGLQKFLLNRGQGLPPQSARDFGPDIQTLIESKIQGSVQPESTRPNRPLNAERFSPNDSNGLPPQLARDLVDTDIQTQTERGQGPARFSSQSPPRYNRPPQAGSQRFKSNKQAFSGEPPSLERDTANLNVENVPVNDRVVNSQYSQTAERLPSTTPNTPIRSQPANSETEINSLPNSSERPTQIASNGRESSVRSQANQQAIAPGSAVNPQLNVARPTEQSNPPATDVPTTRIQSNSQTITSNPGFSINPPSNIPRLIIEFPSSANGDQSIRLQLNPNSLPTNAGTAINPQPSTPRIPPEVPSSPVSADSSNSQANQQALPANIGATITPQSNVAQIPAQLPSPATTDTSLQVQNNQQGLSSNAGQAVNSQVNIQRLPAEIPVLPAIAAASNNFQLNQQIPINAGLAANSQPKTPSQTSIPSSDDSLLRVQPNSQSLRTNSGFTINRPSNLPGIPLQLTPTAPRNPSSNLQPVSQNLPSNAQLAINPLSKTLAFPSPIQSTIPPTLRNLPTSVQSNPNVQSSNVGQALSSVSNTDSVQLLPPVTRDSTARPQINSQVKPNADSATNSPSNSPVLLGEVQTTPSPVVRESSARSQSNLKDSTAVTEAAVTSQSKAPATDAPSKPNVQVPPVDLRLTININSNIPGFPNQLQPTSNTPQIVSPNSQSSNNTQLNTPTLSQKQSSPLPPTTSEPAKLRPINSEPINSLSNFNSFPTSTQLPVDLLPPGINNSPLRSQSNFQTPVNFGSSFNTQFNARGFPVTPSLTQDSAIRTQPFSQFFNSNSGTISSQFNTPGRFFDPRSRQSQQPVATQDEFTRFQPNSQFLPGGSSINSQFNNPGRPFERQSQQLTTQDFQDRFQSNAQFLPENAGSSINSQFNNFGPRFTLQDSQDSLRPTPQVFTSNAGLAVNSLSYSPGLSVELLPPTPSDSSDGLRANQEVSTTNEQPRVSFLVNSPELSAELLPPVVSETSISSQSANTQSVQAPSPQPPVTRLSSFQSNPQFLPTSTARAPNFPVPSIELLPPLDPFLPEYSQNPNFGPPNPIDIPKPPVPALVPPPREQLRIPIDIPKPDVPALVPPPRERTEIPIDIPKPDVPALVPPPREHSEVPIDIPKPDVPALVPPPRPSDRAASARLIPPIPTTFAFNPSNISSVFQQESVPNPDSGPLNPISTNLQLQQPVQTSSDNPILILPKPNSRQQYPQTGENIPLSILDDLSKKVGFSPQNRPAPFSAAPAQLPTRSQTQPGTAFQITEIRAGRVQPIVQEVITAGIPSQIPPKTENSQITFLRNPVSQGLQPPLFPTADPNSQQTAFDSGISDNQTKEKLVQNDSGQLSIGQRLTSTLQPPTQTLLPPTGQELQSDAPPTISLLPPTNTPFLTISAQTSSLRPSSEPQTVNIVPPKPTAESSAVGQTTQNTQTQQALPQSTPEGFVIFQTPTVTVTSQSNLSDSPINVTVVTQGGTGFIKPNTTLTAEPVRPVNQQPPRPEQQSSTSTPISSSTISDLSGSSLVPLNQRTSSPDQFPSSIVNLLPPLDTGSARNNFSSNPFAPPFNQSPFSSLASPFRFPNFTNGANHGPGTACPKLDLQHKGHKAPQFGGNLILSPGFYPLDDPTPTRCDTRGGIEGKKFNWWQILLNNGGEPSTLSRENESEDVKIPELTNPCIRPFETEGVPVFYNTTKTDSQTYYREEIAYHRFPQSKSTFLESRGLFVWKQAKSSSDSTAYLVLYTRDDSGFWVQIKDVDCKFDKNVQPNLQCRSVPECFCNGDEKRCTESVPVLTRNFPVKTFRF